MSNMSAFTISYDVSREHSNNFDLDDDSSNSMMFKKQPTATSSHHQSTSRASYIPAAVSAAEHVCNDNPSARRLEELLKKTNECIEDAKYAPAPALPCDNRQPATTMNISSTPSILQKSRETGDTTSNRSFLSPGTEELQKEPIQSPPFQLFSSTTPIQSRNSLSTSRVLYSPAGNRLSMSPIERSRARQEDWAVQSGQHSSKPLPPQQHQPRVSPLEEDTKEDVCEEQPRKYKDDAVSNDKIRRELSLQEARIHALEHENRELRDLVTQFVTTTKSEKHHIRTTLNNEKSYIYNDSSKQAPSRDKDPVEGTHAEMYSSKHTTDLPASFSPGSIFVAELSQVLEVDTRHHALLSTIMDKHYQHGSEFSELDWHD